MYLNLNLYKYTGAKLSIVTTNAAVFCRCVPALSSDHVMRSFLWKQLSNEPEHHFSVCSRNSFYAGVNKFFLCLPFTEKVLNISAALQS